MTFSNRPRVTAYRKKDNGKDLIELDCMDLCTSGPLTANAKFSRARSFEATDMRIKIFMACLDSCSVAYFYVGNVINCVRCHCYDIIMFFDEDDVTMRGMFTVHVMKIVRS